MTSNNNRSYTLLAFSLGPVQSFIEAARSVRDLWTGSYVLSWLTAAAMNQVVEKYGTEAPDKFISPAIDNNLLLKAIRGQLSSDEHKAAAIPCSPNRFVVRVLDEDAEQLETACIDACMNEWQIICDAVKDVLWPKFDELGVPWEKNEWDDIWNAQIQSHFDCRTARLPLGQCSEEVLVELEVEQLEYGWREMDVLAGMMDARKAARHIPQYEPRCDQDGYYPAKCSMLGTLEQMGPAELGQAAEFWTELSRWKGLDGTKLRRNDRFCAVSLVKRFAWPAYFMDKLSLQPKDLRYSDAATVAARLWLNQKPEIDPNEWWDNKKYWSGQWLHWTTRDQEEDEPWCPETLWQLLRQKKRKQGRLPTYYVILMMDGDGLGKLFRGLRDAKFGKGKERHQAISPRLSRFALQVEEIVKQYHGEVIYSGGDDTRVLLPAHTALLCANALRLKYEEYLQGDERHTVSAGLAVVHIKEDLRFAQRMALAAEKQAKDAGRNALTLTVCRRSGEHASATLGWNQVQHLQDLVHYFIGKDGRRGISDRWAYKLRTELPTLQGLTWSPMVKETQRLLDRVEGDKGEQIQAFRKAVLDFMQAYYEEMTDQKRDKGDMHERCRSEAKVFGDFVTLCQSASFLARGRDE